jgi:hypothetical protein
LTVALKGASIVSERLGVCANVLVCKQRCDICEYLSPTNSFTVAILPDGTYDTQSFFTCPSCADYQVVRIG